MICTVSYESSFMPFPLGNFVWAFKAENVYNGSFFKQ